jgi:DNA-binding protein YbaB
VLGRDLDEGDGWARSWRDQASGGSEAATALAYRVAELTATATGADGAVRVTVASSGVVTGLELDDRVQRMGGAALAGEILRVIRRAQAGLTERVAEAVEEIIGSDTEAGRAVLDSYRRRFPAEPQEPPASPVMPSPPPFPSFPNVPQQSSGSGRSSRGR